MKRLDKRYATQGGVATGSGVVGTTLALGKVLAAVACIVMRESMHSALDGEEYARYSVQD
jgi:hypothetical protein